MMGAFSLDERESASSVQKPMLDNIFTIFAAVLSISFSGFLFWFCLLRLFVDFGDLESFQQLT
jgi:hypothetical protein